jgi:hypothetical protein
MNDEPENEDFDFDNSFQESITAMAKIGLTVFRAVLRDGGTWNEAFAVTGAFFAGSMKANMEDDSDN